MTIYERIKVLRVKKGMSQEELAKAVGYVGRSAISKVEKGERDISQSMIAKYANALGVSPAYLLYGEENEKAPVETDERLQKATELFSQLSTEHQDLVLSQMTHLMLSLLGHAAPAPAEQEAERKKEQ